jgi:hypothetical protein
LQKEDIGAGIARDYERLIRIRDDRAESSWESNSDRGRSCRACIESFPENIDDVQPVILSRPSGYHPPQKPVICLTKLEQVGKPYMLWTDKKCKKWGMESTFCNFKMNAYTQP